PAVDAPASAVGDPALLLYVDVDQLTRAFALVAHDHAGRAIEIAQERDPAATKHPVDRGVGLSERPGDPVRSLERAFPALEDRGLALGTQTPGRAVGSA